MVELSSSSSLEFVQFLRGELKELLRTDDEQENAVYRANTADLIKSRDDLDALITIANEVGRIDANIRIIARRAKRKKASSDEKIRDERYRNSNPNYGRF